MFIEDICLFMAPKAPMPCDPFTGAGGKGVKGDKAPSAPIFGTQSVPYPLWGFKG